MMGQQQMIFALIAKFSGSANNVVVNRTLCQIMGSLEGGVFLSQLLFWSDKGKDDWFYKSYKEWEEETFLSEYQVRQCAKICVGHKFLETKVAKARGNPTVHYKVDIEKFSDWLLKNLGFDSLNFSESKVEKLQEPLTETTTEITTKTTTHNKKTLRSRSSRAEPPHPNTQPICQAYIDKLGYTPTNFGREAKAAKELAKLGFTPEEVVEAYQKLKAQSFYREKFLGLGAVLREIRELTNYTKGKEVQDGQVGSSSGYNPEEIAAIRAAKQRGDIDEAGRLLRAANERLDAQA